MSGQIRVTSRYSGLLIYFVMFVEVVICGGLFSIFAYYRGSDFGNEFLQSMSVICTIYFAVTIEGGVNLHMRRAKDYEVLLTVLKNVFISRCSVCLFCTSVVFMYIAGLIICSICA